jgi:hypothetical protein
MPEVATPVPAEEAVDEPHWGNLHFQLLPRSLLWQPPLANQHEPRMEIVATSLNNDNTKKTLDTAIGGTAPLLRVSGDDPHDGMEVDFFGVVLSRFAKYNTLDDADYRFGLPLTWASGPWSAKLSYEHTSSHIGDDFIKWEAAGLEKRGHVRDEVVTGLSYRWWNQLRLYGQFGYAMNLSTAGPMKHDRYDFGLEWSRQVSTGFRGQPFAAIDVDVRGDENHTPNVTAQVGWQWQELDSRLPSLRLAVEFYDGRSPYGQFFDVHEQWIGGGIYLDF